MMIDKCKLIVMILIVSILVIPNIAQANTVEYRGESEGLIITPNDFFLDFGELLPGDEKSDTAYIRNSTDDEIEVFFKTEPLSKTEYYDDIDYSLLDKLMLRITLKHNGEENLIYDGNLGACSLSEYISLGKYDKGYDGEFKFEVQVPDSLKNEYTLSATKVKWVFFVQKYDEDLAPKDDVGVGELITGNIKTGDYIFLFVALIVVSLIAMAIVIVVRNMRKDNK